MPMNASFVQVNGRILDVKDYRKSLVLVKNYVVHKLKEDLSSEGFTLIRGRDSNTYGSQLLFYNSDLDLELKLAMKKKSKWAWV